MVLSRPWRTVLGLTMVAAVARLVGLGGGLWVDEIYSLLDSFRPSLSTILTEFPDCQSFLVEAEEGGMKQVFLNLARNALQAMTVGGILRISGQATDGRIYVVFKDSGDGIVAHDLEHVFKPFHTTKAGGTGLGLPIAARIVEGNGGTIRVKSTPGVGTAFTVELPAARGSSAAFPAPKKEREAQPVEARNA